MKPNDQQVRTDPTPQEAPMARAELAGIPGTGTLKVMRGQEGSTLDVRGTWRLSDDDEARDVEALRRAHRDGTPITFHGTLADPAHPERETVTLQVRISSASTYAYDEAMPRDRRGESYEVFNFEPAEGLPYD